MHNYYYTLYITYAVVMNIADAKHWFHLSYYGKLIYSCLHQYYYYGSTRIHNILY